MKISWEWPEWQRLLGVAVVVAGTAWFGIELTREGGRVASIWVANGALLAVLLTTRGQHWPAYLMVGFLANFAADRLSGDPALVALSLSFCNTTEILIAVAGLRWHLADASNLVYRRALGYFVFYGVLLAPGFAAVLAATLLNTLGAASFWQVFRTWYLADAIGIAIITPLALSIRRRELAALFHPTALAQTLTVLAGMVAVTVAVFTQSTYPLLFVLFPALLLVVFQLGFTGTAIGIFLTAVISILFTIENSGPIMMIDGLDVAQRILFLQFFILTSVLMALPVAVILAEREQLRADLEHTNRVLQSLAMTDGLTGLANRRHFDDVLDREWRRAIRESRTLSLLLLDIDHFKSYNDYYGHTAGDECLKGVAQALMKAAHRPGDSCARYGGEEFAVILPDTDAVGATAIAEAIRESIEVLAIEHVRTALGHVTLSIGLVSVEPDSAGMSAVSLIQRADRALYGAKAAGRNRIAVAEAESQSRVA
jgi:diguanylate cyclase (GGDEF)-like protein